MICLFLTCCNGDNFLAKLSSIPFGNWHDISFNVRPIGSTHISYRNVSSNWLVHITLYVVCKLVPNPWHFWHFSWNVSMPLFLSEKRELKVCFLETQKFGQPHERFRSENSTPFDLIRPSQLSTLTGPDNSCQLFSPDPTRRPLWHCLTRPYSPDVLTRPRPFARPLFLSTKIFLTRPDPTTRFLTRPDTNQQTVSYWQVFRN